jgi:2Fe-2S ferredoxin
MKVTFIEPDGTTREVGDAAEGLSLMEIAKANGIAGITADCGGSCACATCHVYVEGDWFAKVGEPDDIEAAMLDMVTDVLRENSRLSCQIRMRDELDGIRLTVAPVF